MKFSWLTVCALCHSLYLKDLSLVTDSDDVSFITSADLVVCCSELFHLFLEEFALESLSVGFSCELLLAISMCPVQLSIPFLMECPLQPFIFKLTLKGVGPLSDSEDVDPVV